MTQPFAPFPGLQVSKKGGGGPGPPPPPGTINALQVINTGDIPTAGPSNNVDLELGGDGMPAPATFTTSTGRVRVLVEAVVQTATQGDQVTYWPLRDGVRIDAPWSLRAIGDANSNGGNDTLITLEFLDTVAPGSTHTWGAHLQNLNPGGGSPCNILPEKASIVIQDVTSSSGGSIIPGPPGPSLVPAAGPMAHFIDPSNSSGLASNANDGQTALTPILTVEEQNHRIRIFSILNDGLTADFDMLLMSDITLPTSHLDLSPLNIEHFTLTVRGTPAVLHTGGTLDAGTLAIDPTVAGGGQAQTAHLSDLADIGPFLWAPFGGAQPIITRIVDTTSGAGAWMRFGAGTALAEVSRPINADRTTGALTIGNGYRIQRGSILRLAAAPAPRLNTTGKVVFSDFAFTADSVGPASVEGFTQGALFYDRCSFDGVAKVGGTYTDCAWLNGQQGNFSATLDAGLWIPNSNTDQQTGVITTNRDVYATGLPGFPRSLTVGGSFNASVFVLSLQVQRFDTVGSGAILFQEGASWIAGSPPWGKNNAGFGVQVFPNTDIQFVEGFGAAPNLVATQGDFTFTRSDLGGPIGVARAWDNAIGAYTEAGGPATRLCSWANLFTPIAGGGFDNNAVCLEAAASFSSS